MLKLYKRIKGKLHYHEAWADRAKIMEHWGTVGERGETATHKRNKKLSEEDDFKQILSKPLSDGYKPIEPDDQATLLIEYAVKGMGASKDLKKRHALEDRMNETLGWTGLGMCDGGSIGSGTMEVCCFVVDFKIAKRVIEEDLNDTEFGNYTRIYDEEAGPPPTRVATPAPPMLAPPWVMFEKIARDDADWQTGAAAEYLAKWTDWFLKLPAAVRTGYSSIFPEPNGWSGLYESALAKARG
jgi:hypothetical protein